MEPDDVAIIKFADARKFRSFTVLLSYYNSIFGCDRNVYIHAASKKRQLEYCLVATTIAEREAELADYNKRGEWRKLIDKEWKNS